jgi:general secretion pathway protein D
MKLRAVLWTLVVVSVAPPLLGAQEEPEVLPADSMVTLDFQQAELQLVLGALAEIAGLSVTYGPLPDRLVTLRTGGPVPATDVRGMLEAVARANGVILVAEGGLIRLESVEPISEPAPRGSVGPGGQRAQEEERRLFVETLSHATAERMVRTVGALFGVGGTQTFGAGGGGPSTLTDLLRGQREAPFLEESQPSRGFGTQVGSGMQAGLSQPVDMVPDPLTNSVLVLATPADFAVIQAAIQQLDVRPLQVLIEVMIAEVRHNRESDLGVDISVEVDDVSFSLSGYSAGDVALQVLGIGGTDADVLIRALATKSDVRVVSRPIILAQNNREARILVGDQRPFIQVFRALPTDAAVRDQVVQYRDVGTQLTIVPTINADGYVNLSIVQEVSNATAETQFGAPVINTREVESELTVRDGQTVVLGGLVDHVEQESNSGIPLLKDIPLIGALFRSSQKSRFASELLLMVTPHVIRTDQDLGEISRGLRGELSEADGAVRERDLGLDTLGLARIEPDTLGLPRVPLDTLRLLEVRPDTLRTDPEAEIGR